MNKSNLDCLFQICSTDSQNLTIESRYLRLMSVVKVDNMHQNMTELDSPHLIDDPQILEIDDVLNRIVRISQNYKVSLVHGLNLN